uniref:NET domain-containing protein n=1 Tax=viral metagenome TaxID=1070528 RepID=A0A6C0HNE5_9ZZZZ
MVNKQLIKEKIELLSKQHQIELLRILSIIPGISISENNNGVFINLTQQNDIVFEKIENFLEYVNIQQKSLSFLEKQQDDIETEFFSN